MFTPAEIRDRLDRILPRVQKPGRYTGGELNQVVKNWDAVATKVAVVFPDIYDIGMSNLGTFILYDLLNKRPDILAERCFAPWSDMEEALRSGSLPLYSLETLHPLADFDIIGISLPYESLYTNALNMLDLAGIPLFSAERTAQHPLVIAGGHSTYNPEPMHAFIDAFVIGEGEEVIQEIVDAHQKWRQSNAPRLDLLRALAKIWGVYVPALYDAQYEDDGTFKQMVVLDPAAPKQVIKRITARLPDPPTRFIVPYIDTVHKRIPIEIMRGCTRGCRFCQAGMITRPVRERSVAEVVEAIEESLKHTGFEEVSLMSLSSSDYTHVLELVKTVGARYAGEHLEVSLPSLRIESFSVDLMEALKDNRHSGFTLAPEAATERMRKIINKPVSTEQLLNTAHEIYSRGWTTIKLYFMIGHPSETLEDVQAIADLCKQVLAEGRKVIGRRAKVHAGVSTFVPKPHTPFQWVSCDTREQVKLKQNLLRDVLYREHDIKLSLTDPNDTQHEAWLSRGDRRLAEVIFRAWKKGAKFDAWKEHYHHEIWTEAFAECGLDPEFYTHRQRLIDEAFPWEHISTTVRRKFLTEDYLWSLRGQTRVDCRERCFACGILPTFAELRSLNPGEVWQCPEVKPKSDRRPVITNLVEIPVQGD